MSFVYFRWARLAAASQELLEEGERLQAENDGCSEDDEQAENDGCSEDDDSCCSSDSLGRANEQGSPVGSAADSALRVPSPDRTTSSHQ